MNAGSRYQMRIGMSSAQVRAMIRTDVRTYHISPGLSSSQRVIRTYTTNKTKAPIVNKPRETDRRAWKRT